MRSEAGVELRYRRLVRSYSQLSAQNRALLAQLDRAQPPDRTTDLTKAAEASNHTMWSSDDADCEQLERACSDDCDAVGDMTADTAVQSAASSVSSWSIPSAPPSPCASQSDSDLAACQECSLSADAEETDEHGDVALEITAAKAAETTTRTVTAPVDAATAAEAITVAAAAAAAVIIVAPTATTVATTAAVKLYQQQHCDSAQQQRLHSPKHCISPMRSVSLSWACAWTTTPLEQAHTADVLTQPRRSQPIECTQHLDAAALLSLSVHVCAPEHSCLRAKRDQVHDRSSKQYTH
eukprot:11317-Heterococcus_DN1.PRE.4